MNARRRSAALRAAGIPGRVTGGDNLLHVVTYGTPPPDPSAAANTRIRELQRELATLKGEGAPASDPRVTAAIGELARLLATQKLAGMVGAAFGEKR